MKKKVEFYFDFISGFSYLAWLQLKELRKKYDLEIVAQPVVFAALLNHWGSKGPAEIPSKRRWAMEALFRQAVVMGVPINSPKYHPFYPIPALRLSLAEVSGDDQEKVIDAIYRAGWIEAQDIGDEQVLTSILEGAAIDCDGCFKQIKETSIKEKLKENTQTAIQKGVFGVPTMLIDEEFFWGSDQVQFLELYLQGKDPLDREVLNEILSRLGSVSRI